jgi:hypothetical protein
VRKAAATCECFGMLIVLELVRSISLMVDLAGHEPYWIYLASVYSMPTQLS